MSPERLNSRRAEASADVYALACVLYEALTGRRPFPGDSLEQQVVSHLTTPPPKPSALARALPVALDAVVGTGMAKNPTDRYGNASDFARAARNALDHPVPLPETAKGRVVDSAVATRSVPSPSAETRLAPKEYELKRTRREPPTVSAASLEGPRASSSRRRRRVIITLLSVVALCAGGVVGHRILYPPLAPGESVLPFTDLSQLEERQGDVPSRRNTETKILL